MTEFCPLCGAAVERVENTHACYDPPSFERLFRDEGWAKFWAQLRPLLEPALVRQAHDEFAHAKAQGREATRLFALATFRQWTVAVLEAQKAKAAGVDPRDLLARTMLGMKQVAANAQRPGTGG